MEKTTALAALAITIMDRDRAEQRITDAVIDAKHAGASWAAIAAQLGITKQRAHQIYAAVSASRDPSTDHMYTDDENTAADEALRIMQAIAHRQDTTTPSPTPSKISDTPAPAPAPKSSIFSDAGSPAPADDWQQDDPKHFALPIHERRFGACGYCGQKSHTSKGGGTWIYRGCTPTLNDPLYTES